MNGLTAKELPEARKWKFIERQFQGNSNKIMFQTLSGYAFLCAAILIQSGTFSKKLHKSPLEVKDRNHYDNRAMAATMLCTMILIVYPFKNFKTQKIILKTFLNNWKKFRDQTPKNLQPFFDELYDYYVDYQNQTTRQITSKVKKEFKKTFEKASFYILKAIEEHRWK